MVIRRVTIRNPDILENALKTRGKIPLNEEIKHNSNIFYLR